MYIKQVQNLKNLWVHNHVGAFQLEEKKSKHINHNKHENKERNGEPKHKGKCNWKEKEEAQGFLGP
jgi:hypothetical protein